MYKRRRRRCRTVIVLHADKLQRPSPRNWGHANWMVWVWRTSGKSLWLTRRDIALRVAIAAISTRQADVHDRDDWVEHHCMDGIAVCGVIGPIIALPSGERLSSQEHMKSRAMPSSLVEL
ncbi:hypothetical protein B0H12DRAFT_1114060 [Mycena haematopus]|nr:hypothetical protein B0H12DRAFT_1114060 [Mycena haematopus]